MPEIQYIEKRFRDDSMDIIRKARSICASYAAQGFDLTLRQLYYQFVARGFIANKQTEYDRLGSIINDARLAGLLDWNYIVDRTRNVKHVSHWDGPASLVRDASKAFAMDRWSKQEYHVEVWIEKDALVGVLQQCCPAEDVSYFSCRGYTSQSEIWSAAQRLGEYIEAGKKVVILHLGDHDPSGIDMTRDIEHRLAMFISQDHFGSGPGETMDDFLWDVQENESLEIRRIALNMAQVQQYNPPPNPAKLTDSRAIDYIARHGRSSWELDALDPPTLTALIQQEIDYLRDDVLWKDATDEQERQRALLTAASDHWTDVAKYITTTHMP